MKELFDLAKRMADALRETRDGGPSFDKALDLCVEFDAIDAQHDSEEWKRVHDNALTRPQPEAVQDVRELRDCFSCGHYTEMVSGCDPAMPKCAGHEYWIPRDLSPELEAIRAYIAGCPRKSLTDKLNRDTALAALARLASARAEGEAHCPSCGCAVDDAGNGHHSAADCIFLRRVIEAERNGEEMRAALEIAVAALERVKTDKAPVYHDCLDDGLDACAWCDVIDAIPICRAALATPTEGKEKP